MVKKSKTKIGASAPNMKHEKHADLEQMSLEESSAYPPLKKQNTMSLGNKKNKTELMNAISKGSQD